MPITKIHFLGKAREGLWITAKNNPRFLVRDHNGQALAYVYFEDEPGRRSAATLPRRRSSPISRAISAISKSAPKCFIVAAKQPDGTLQGRAWRAGRDGVTPPM